MKNSRDSLGIRDQEVRLYFWRLYDSHIKEGLPSDQARSKTYDDMEIRFFIQKKSVDAILRNRSKKQTFPKGLIESRNERLRGILKTVNEDI